MLDYVGQTSLLPDLDTIYCNSLSEYKRLTNDNENFSLINLNIRSINKNYDQFLILLQGFKKKFDIIILTETWAIRNKIEFSLDDYNIECNNTFLNQNDGTVVYVNKELESNVEIINNEEFSFILVKTKKQNKNINLLATYRSPNTNAAKFISILESILENHQIDFVVGDINIDILDKSYLSEKYVNMLNNQFLKSAINKPTRVTEHSATCLDHIFYRDSKFIKNSKLSVILKTYITDHYTSIMTINLKSIKGEIKKETYKIKKNINFDVLSEKLENESWNFISETEDLNHAAKNFINRLKEIINNCTTRETIKLNKNVCKIKPWITQGLIISINKRDKLKNKLMREPFNKNLKDKYKHYRNLVNKLIKLTKKNYYAKKLIEQDGNPAKTWELIKEITNHNIKKNSTILPDTQNNNELANNFNEYFTQVGIKMANKIKKTNSPGVNKTKNNIHTLYLNPVTPNEIEDIITNLKHNCAPGLDEITNTVLKSSKKQIIEPLTALTNRALSEGIFPDIFKKAVIIPIHKGGDRNELGNYRPISLLSSVGKIIEKCINNRLNNFLNKHNLLNTRQYGFKENCSTEDAIIDLTSALYNAVNNNLKALTIFIDLAKAYDTVNHKLLLEKLEKLGVRGVGHNLLKSYLESRFQCTRVKDSISNIHEVKCGIPQGSVLGCTLFSIYIDEMLSLNIPGNIIAYADDTALIITGPNWQRTFENAQKSMSTAQAWLTSNQLTLNTQKTKFITYSLKSSNQPITPVLIIPDPSNNNRNYIEKTSHIKYLGIYIDENLSWAKHIETVTKKIRSMYYIFKKLITLLPLNIVLTTYYGLVQSILQYGIAGWGGSTNHKLKQIFVAQKTILKIMYNKPKTYPTEELFSETKIFNIRKLYTKAVLINIFKNNSKEFITTNTRQATEINIKVPKAKKTKFKQHLLYLGPKLHNALPTEIKLTKNHMIFKKSIKTWLMSSESHIINDIIS